MLPATGWYRADQSIKAPIDYQVPYFAGQWGVITRGKGCTGHKDSTPVVLHFDIDRMSEMAT